MHCYSLAGFSVAIGIYGAAHAVVGSRVGKQGRNLADDFVVVRADQFHRAGLQRLRSFRRVAHHQDGLA